ncbi:hypothetical protein K402DRAFT_443483 [Aulographum hederae CBS 113979]|uniref:CoA-dependent acyltransferase n=1 Tax=Aulographum hederae CBS 113979 TaxID=1176131 RepID=A0A6G1HGB6_9PEZI|nr:hypothetical protein K402DRAFT_443483 [Aulographum hederae CBS 113979]
MEHFSAGYASRRYDWKDIVQQDEHNPPKHSFKRLCGVVETSFYVDGDRFEGRADLNSLLTLEIRTNMAENDLRAHIQRAWMTLRCRHPLLLAKTNPIPENDEKIDSNITVLWDKFQKFSSASDADILYFHSQNTARVFQGDKTLTHLFVLPLETLPNGNRILRTLQVTGHMITDGLTMFNWNSDFIRLLNLAPSKLKETYQLALEPSNIKKSLPPAQESLYAPVPGNLARQRLFWLLLRILRYVRKPLPTPITNPLLKDEPPKDLYLYSDVFDWSVTPPTTTGHTRLFLSPAATKRVTQLSKAAGATLGAGSFTVVGLAMMSLYAKSLSTPPPFGLHPPFIASFPWSPRAFFNHKECDSCMLAFSDGLILPYLPPSIPIEKRFSFLVKIANRQLAAYQRKSSEKGVQDGLSFLDSRAALRTCANTYLIGLERVEAKTPEEFKGGVNPQGEYDAKWMATMGATCGISSVGLTSGFVKAGTTKLDLDLSDGTKTRDEGDEKILQADFRSVDTGVRARDKEFLVQCSGDGERMRFGVSYDLAAYDEKKVEEWKRVMEGLLEPGSEWDTTS